MCLVLAAVLECSAARANWGGVYTYSPAPAAFGTHSLALDAATLRGGHVAVWVGAQTDLGWVQVGIALGAGRDRTFSTPYLYLERSGGHLVPIRPVAFGEMVTVGISCRGASCSASGGGATLRAYLPRAHVAANGESWETLGRNAYTGRIDRATVSR